MQYFFVQKNNFFTEYTSITRPTCLFTRLTCPRAPCFSGFSHFSSSRTFSHFSRFAFPEFTHAKNDANSTIFVHLASPRCSRYAFSGSVLLLYIMFNRISFTKWFGLFLLYVTCSHHLTKFEVGASQSRNRTVPVSLSYPRNALRLVSFLCEYHSHSFGFYVFRSVPVTVMNRMTNRALPFSGAQ